MVSFLDDLAAGTPAPGAGAAAAHTLATAAALVGMVARSSPRLAAAPSIAEQADAWRRQALEAGEEDGRRYAEVLASERDRASDPATFQSAVADANVVPSRLVELAEAIARQAADLVADGSPRLRGDARAAAVLAEGGASTAMVLLELNTAYGGLGSEHLEVVRDHLGRCREQLERAGGRA